MLIDMRKTLVPRTFIHRFLMISLVFLIVGGGLQSQTSVNAADVNVAPQNPAFTIERGADDATLRANFNLVPGVDLYRIRMYSQIDNYENKWVDFDVAPNTDFSHGGTFTDSSCINISMCLLLRDGRGLKFTIQLYTVTQDPEYAQIPVTEESPKSIVHYPVNMTASQITLSTPIDAELSTLRSTFTPLTGHSSLSLRLYRSTDSYSEVAQELTGIPPGVKDLEVEGGYTYKFRFRAEGSRTSNAVYLASGWSAMQWEAYPIYRRPNAPANVRITASDRTISAAWDEPAPVTGVTINAYQMGLSTDRITWSETYLGNVRSFDYQSISSNRLVNGTAYWVKLQTIGSYGVKKTWFSSIQYTPAYTPSAPIFNAIVGDERIDVSWTEPSNGGAPITGYVLQYSADNTNWTNISLNASARSRTISSLQNGTAYTVRGYAVNNVGSSWTETYPQSLTPVGSPIPKTSDVTKIGTTSATIALEVDSKGNFVVPKLSTDGPDNFAVEHSGASQKGSSIIFTKTLTGLAPATVYNVQAKATAGVATYSGARYSFSTTPDAPSNLAATMTGTTASVSWNQLNTNGDISYQVWAEQNGIEAGNRCTIIYLYSSCEISGLTPGRTYVIKATAKINDTNFGNGTSLPASISATTLASQTITFSFGTLPQKGYGYPEFDLSSYGSSTSGLSITYTSRTSTKCQVFTRSVRIIAAGTCTIRASQAGNSRFGAATPVDASFTIASTQSITFSTSSIGTQTLGGSSLDLSSLATASSSLTVTFSTNSPENCSIDGTTVTYLHAGVCGVIASQSGSEDFLPATNVLRNINVQKGTQATLTLSSTTGTYGTVLTLVSGGGSGDGIVTFAIDTASSSATASDCSIAGNFLTSTSAGKCAVIVTKAANSDYNSKTSSSTLVTLNKAAQTITFLPIAGSGPLLEGGSVSASARSTSQLTVTITSDTETECTVSGTTVSLLVDGICTLRGTQAGNSSYLAATAVTVSFEISPKLIPEMSPINYTRLTSPQTYRVGDTVELSVPGATYQGAPVAGSYEFISTLPESFTFGTPTVDGDGITRVTVTFQRADNAFNLYAVFTPVDTVNFTNGQTFSAIQVAARPQTILVSSGLTEFGNSLPITHSGIESVGQIFTDLSPMTHLSQPVNFSDQNAHCTISNGTVTRDNPGFCYVRVSSLGDGRFESSLGVAEFAFSKKTQSIGLTNTAKLDSLTALDIQSTIDITTLVSATSSLTVVVTSLTTSVCSVSGFDVTIVSSGICSLEFSQAGDDSYQSSPDRTYQFEITRLAQDPISLADQDTTFGSALSLSISGGSGLGTVSYSITDGLASGCESRNNTLVSATSGTCLVTVTKNGDSTYLPHTSETMAVDITRATQSITFSLTGLPTQRVGGAGFNLASYSSVDSGNVISFRVEDADVCAIVSGIVTSKAEGTCTITASQDGSDNYVAATNVVQSFTVSQALPIIDLETVNTTIAPPVQIIDLETVNTTIAPAVQIIDLETVNTTIAPPVQINVPRIQSKQIAPRTPTKGKLGRSIKFTMKAPSGLPLKVKASSACKSSAVSKTVTTKKKVNGKIKVITTKVQIGWTVTFSKKGTCKITFKNSGDAAFLPMNQTSSFRIS
jgi:hypothetical protein